jgi:amidophosphoribosyltransferase
MVHNGNVVNTEELRRDLRTRAKRHLLTHSDTEAVLNIFAEALARTPAGESSEELNFEHVCAAVGEVFARANGAMSIVTLVADHGLVAFRDPLGLRPLILGRRPARRAGEEAGAPVAHIVASESVALSFLGYEPMRNLEPGEVVFIDMQGNVHSRVLSAARAPRHCMFEWIYFASPESEIDGVPVYGTRINLGRSLARLLRQKIEDRQIEADIVVPVPETSRIAAIALAEELKIPYREVLIKNRYIKRTFILDSQEKRQKAVSLKLSPVRSEIQGKRVILVDDSIVRGTTSKKIIELVRQAGASKVYFVSTCPPIKHPCYYGIDFPDQNELIAAGRGQTEIERELGADAVIYQDLEGLETAIREAGSGKMKGRPCMACLDGKYPTDVGAGEGLAAARTAQRKQVKS